MGLQDAGGPVMKAIGEMEALVVMVINAVEWGQGIRRLPSVLRGRVIKKALMI